jgi:hypothetical protein
MLKLECSEAQTGDEASDVAYSRTSAVEHPRAYVQRLPALGLSIEHRTERVPDDAGWYLMRGDERLGRFRSLKLAQSAYAEAIAQSRWKPPPRSPSSDLVAREAQRRNDEAFFEYWYGGIHSRRGRQRR